MTRYFIELSYKGTRYAGFQIQANAATIQSEVTRALSIYFKTPFLLTGSSRTDAGVHAAQNYFHFDFGGVVPEDCIYNLNSILPPDIAIRRIFPVVPDAHCRFDAIARNYRYVVYRFKDPFIWESAYYYPYSLDGKQLRLAAEAILGKHDFYGFSKRNTQVKNFECCIMESRWTMEESRWYYQVKANRFLRGMVRGLVGTMLHVGRGKMSADEFISIIRDRETGLANFSVPGKGLWLDSVEYPDSIIRS